MKFVVFIAKRYLFSHKKHGLVNLISAISMGGVAIGTMALIIVMSIINGLDDKVHQTYSDFVPDLEIRPIEGSVFSIEDSIIQTLFCDTNYLYVGKRMQQQALLTKNGIQVPIVITGVDTSYYKATSIADFIWTGQSNVHNTLVPTAVLGLGLANQLGTGKDLVSPTFLYAPKRSSKINLMRPDAAFRKYPFYIGGVVNVDIQSIGQLVLMPLTTVQKLYDYPQDMVSSIALSLKDASRCSLVEKRLEQEMINKYHVFNRQEANADLFQMLRIEKWMTFLILSFIVLISICNVIGSLSMLIIDKEKDIRLLQNIGASRRNITHIFWLEGWLITVVGTFLGGLIGILFCKGQQSFDWIMMGHGSYAIPYPVIVQFSDIFLIFITIIVLGAAIAYYPAYQLSKRIQE